MLEPRLRGREARLCELVTPARNKDTDETTVTVDWRGLHEYSAPLFLADTRGAEGRCSQAATSEEAQRKREREEQPAAADSDSHSEWDGGQVEMKFQKLSAQFPADDDDEFI